MKLLTRQETADYLRIDIRTLERRERAGKMPSRIQVSDRRFVYREVDIVNYFTGKTLGRTKVSADDGPCRLVSVSAEID